ncbi:hypothetical protein LY78DRAFT_421926 [Colletotrichum sublineola]|nr:hypothetical protein LY78DRAFT_421926 [Colletotrichum sublineola]
MQNHSVPRSSYQRAFDDKPSRPFSHVGAPHGSSCAVTSPCSRRTPCHCFPPCSLSSHSRVMSVLYATPAFSVPSTPLFLSSCYTCGQALLRRAPNILPPPFRAPSSPSVPFNASLRALFR